MAIEALPTDKLFKDSPDTGWPECKCSRCDKMIREHEVPLRMMPEGQNAEYRYCESCMKGMGIQFESSYDENGKYIHEDDDFNFHPDHF